MNTTSRKCPICETSCVLEQIAESHEHLNLVRCPRCRTYSVADFAKEKLERALALDETGVKQYVGQTSAPNGDGPSDIYIEVAKKSIHGGMITVRSLLSHVIRKRDSVKRIKLADFANILKHNSTPTPADQANNLILFLGDRLASPGNTYKMPEKNVPKGQENIYGLLGLRIGSEWVDLRFLANSLVQQQLLNIRHLKGPGGGELTSDGQPIIESMALTLSGWQKSEELKRSITDTRKAFVAMAFANSAKPEEDYFFQNELLDQYLIPAVRQTRYELSNPLASDPMAGNIHARMEVEIRTARFVVAELSHHNNGAYWEAGFARALEKPVIYMYNKTIGKHPTPHFDVGSDHIIFWEKDKSQKAADDLKAVIRATLFGEAKMTDD